MPIITFMSDFGTDDHYVAAVKASILSALPSQVISDISHTIKPFDISQASHVLKNVFRDFPLGTVHIVAVDTMKVKSQVIAIELEGHFLLGFDSGLFSLISEKKPDQIIILENNDSTFPAKDVLAKCALQLVQGRPLKGLGVASDHIMELFARQLKVTKREIAGNVVNVDQYGNLITNIGRSDFEKMLEMNGSGARYVVRFGRENFQQLHTFFTDVESGDCYVFFNSSGILQVGINKGNASELLGLGIDSPVNIEFSNG